MGANGIVTNAGRTLKARLLKGEALQGLGWLAIGDGTWADKTSPPPEDPVQIGLAHETARKRIDRSAYLQLDDAAGTVSFGGRLYREVAGPTPIVAYFASFLEEEAAGFTIAEEGIFAGPAAATASPFATAAQVTSPGILYWLRNRPAYIKGLRDKYEVIAIFEER